MTFNDYQIRATATAVYGEGNKVHYPILGLIGEAGEVANKYKKVLRDDGGILTPKKREELIAELGDVLWYLAALSHDLGTSLNIIAEDNLLKLEDRKTRGVIQGSGDNR